MFNQRKFYNIVKEINDEKFKELSKTKALTLLKTIPDNKFDSILSYGFNLAAYGLALMGKSVHLMNALPECFQDYDDAKFIKINENLEQLYKNNKKYDLVLALEQTTTQVSTNFEQQELIKHFSGITNKYFITTLRDYKNQSPQQKIFDEPFYIKHNKEYVVLLQHKWDINDKQVWYDYMHIIVDNQILDTIGPIKHRTMYFKQLSKFLHDSNVKEFTVHKFPMYKSIFSKNYDYIITAEF